MWNVAIVFVYVVIGNNCYHEEAAIGLLPNGKYVIITAQVNLLFEVKGRLKDYYLLEDSNCEKYGLQIVQDNKGFILFMVNYHIVKELHKPKELRIMISSKGVCNDKTLRH
jgi:hypothetical protein